MRRALGLLAIAAVVAAGAWPMQVTGDNQNSHYALVKALARGMPNIDATLGETGDLKSHDVATHDGRLYAVKSPGLAMAATPTYVVVEAVGARTTGDPTRVLWFLNLFTSVAATLALLLLVRGAANRLEPGLGAATAVVVGLGALTLAFATLFFSHALSTALVFAGFAVLVGQSATLRRVAASGLLVGLAVVVEHSVWIAGAAVGLYAVARTRSLRSAAAFFGAAVVGALPLLAFNVWAFGNPLHTAYIDYWREKPDFDPTAIPRWAGLSPQLFSSFGLLTLAPVVALGLAGSVLLYRRGDRAEALVCVGVPVAFVVYFAANGAFGGLGPPRYLTPIMPFALLPLALTLRRAPLATSAAAGITCFQAVVMTATGPLAAYDGEWLRRAVDKEFVQTAASLVGISGWYAIAPFFLAVLVAVAAGAASLPPLRFAAVDGALAVAVAGAWALAALGSYNDWGRTPSPAYVVAVVGVVAVGAAAAVLATRRRSHVRTT